MIITDLLLRRLDNLISDCFLHEVHLTLPDNLHKLILQWYGQLGDRLATVACRPDRIQLELHTTLELLEASSPATLSQARGTSLHGRMNEEGIILVAKVEVTREVRRVEHVRSVALHLEKVVLVLPDEGRVLELLDVVLVRAHLIVLLRRQQEVVDELLAPLDDAAHDMKRKHAQ